MSKVRQAARDALQVQDACNVSGVARSYVEALMALRMELQLGTKELARHPISVLFAHKLASLAGIEPLGVSDFDEYSRATAGCRVLAGEEL
jgi:hypothetical protein